MKEFRIVIQNGEATPYSLWTFNSFEACYFKLLQMINEQQTHVKKEYYVINDFYDNKYPPFLADIKKYRIDCRDVGEWNVYSEKQQKKKNKNNSKIINLM